MPLRYAHTNLIARDWRALASFYEQVFGCMPVGSERDLGAPWLARATGVAGARLGGIHLRLPGHGEGGPTLEIFQYAESLPSAEPNAAHRRGLRHLAFEVDDVGAMQRKVIDAGGSAVGEIVEAEVEGAGKICFTYVADPEGNLVELQSWA